MLVEHKSGVIYPITSSPQGSAAGLLTASVLSKSLKRDGDGPRQASVEVSITQNAEEEARLRHVVSATTLALQRLALFTELTQCSGRLDAGLSKSLPKQLGKCGGVPATSRNVALILRPDRTEPNRADIILSQTCVSRRAMEELLWDKTTS